MKRTTISLPDDLAAALEREARRCRVPISQIAREALEARLKISRPGPKTLSFIGMGRSGHHTTARDMEELLKTEWTRLDRDR